MNILYNKTETKTQTFAYKINSGGVLNLRVSNGTDRHVTITFIDGKFSKVEHNINGAFTDSRSYWHVMEAINQEIGRIEESINALK